MTIMSNVATIKIKGKEHVLKFGSLSLTRKIRVEKVDLSKLNEDMGIDELFVFLAGLLIPKEEHSWVNEDELIEALEEENDPQALKILRDRFNEYLGFILTLSGQSTESEEGEDRGKSKKG